MGLLAAGCAMDPSPVDPDCTLASDCASGEICTDGRCTRPESCDDGRLTGDETDVDCGGPDCPACANGQSCAAPGDCESRVCDAGACVGAMCNDGVTNGTETDEDCGGPDCPGCGAGASCDAPGDCASGVCAGGSCVTATCSDGVWNGAEADVDCGGPDCSGCARGDGCDGPSDCATDGCVGGVCVVGPAGGFTVTPTEGEAPLVVSVSSTATAGDSAIASTEYDYGEGDGFETAMSHSYGGAGTFTITQRVTDASGFIATATRTVEVSPPSCSLSATDKSPDGDLTLTPDLLGAEFWTLNVAGVRSECSITPGSGVFYYEGTLAPHECERSEAPEGCYRTPYGLLNFGVATSAAALNQVPGTNDQSFGIETGGSIFFDGAYLGEVAPDSTETYGFVVDYRGTNPVVHLITNEYGTPAVVHSQPMTGITGDVFAMVGGARRKVGVEASLNFGNDLTNEPFDFDPVAALNAADLTAEASALVLGFGVSNTPPANGQPTLVMPGDMSVSLGTPVVLSGSASDPEDGDLTAGIYWEDMATVYGSRTDALGGSFTFTPTQIGLHPVRATVVDSDGGRRQAVVRVSVTGALTQYDPVQLVNDTAEDPNVGSGIVTDGLSVRWTTGDHMGIRANQGLYGEFWYFEVTRKGGMVNQGAGLAIWEGDLDPYSADDVPPSMSINTVGGVWQNIIYYDAYDTSNSTYGFAVDYRGENPTVYVVIGGDVVAEWTMVDTFVPVHPMLYGNPTGEGLPFDETANFGATAFIQDPCAALASWGMAAADVQALELGWGDANTSTSCP